MKISILKHLAAKNTSYVVIPFLESTYKRSSQSIFKMINELIPDIMLDDKYKDACRMIDAKFQDKLINIATITISTNMLGGSRKKDTIPHSSALPLTLKTQKNTEHTASEPANTTTAKQENTKTTTQMKMKTKMKTKTKEKEKKTKVSRGALNSQVQTHSKTTLKHLNSLGAGLLQIYMIRVSDTTKDSDSGKAIKGDADAHMLEELRVAGHLIFSILKGNFIRTANLIPLLGSISKSDYLIRALLEGIMLSSYKFDKYKTSKALERQANGGIYHLENLYLITPESKYLARAIARLEKVVASVFLARDLVNEPANDNRFARFITRAREFIADMNSPIELDIWDKAQLEKMGMGLILGVGKGSAPENAPCMLVIKYHPSGKSAAAPDWVLLGKGITFDTGGLDLKKPGQMLEMKSDLSGAAAVVAFLLGYAAIGGSKCIYVMCPFAENSISASAIKPSDVLTAYDGRTVEVVDTDAEGRMVLADVIAYTVAKWPSARIMDLATLTGQAEDVSGKAFSCVLSSNAEQETRALIDSSNRINEALVRLPLLEKELSKLESHVADIKNISYKSSADIIISSLFMKQFIKPGTKWIHIDIAGPAFNADGIIKYASPEASGVGVRMLFEYFST
jgi:leucyl aminopeptidase